MHLSVLIIILLSLVAVAYQLGRRRAVTVVGGRERVPQLHSLPSYHGFYAALWAG
ncbi:MAG: hypothetical protein RLZ44_125, partial [Pseudomonadota bacterium]